MSCRLFWRGLVVGLAALKTAMLLADTMAYLGPAQLPRSKQMERFIASDERDTFFVLMNLETWWKQAFKTSARTSTYTDDVDKIFNELHRLEAKKQDPAIRLLPARLYTIVYDNKPNYQPCSTMSYELSQTAPKDLYSLYDSPYLFSVRYKSGEMRELQLFWSSVSGISQMAVFEKAPKMPKLIDIPLEKLKTFSPKTQAYAKELLTVVNENLAYIGYIPFYYPSKTQFDASHGYVDDAVAWLEDAAGRIIPEKYLLTGKTLERLVKDRETANAIFEPIDLSHVELQKRLGHPVYRLSAYEYHPQLPTYAHAIWNYSRIAATTAVEGMKNGHLVPDEEWPFTRYQKMRYVDSIVQLQVAMPELLKLKTYILNHICAVQYERAQTSLKTLRNGLTQEVKLHAADEEKRKIAIFVFNNANRLITKWMKTLDRAIGENQVIYNLLDPDHDPVKTDNIRYNALRNTWGGAARPYILETFLLHNHEIGKRLK